MFISSRSVLITFCFLQRNYGPSAKTRWFKIRLRNTKDKGYDKAGLLQFFAQELEMAFHAINYVEEESSILFWVQGDELAGKAPGYSWVWAKAASGISEIV